jgi:tetratricopeptide (TPR) repeat protein
MGWSKFRYISLIGIFVGGLCISCSGCAKTPAQKAAAFVKKAKALEEKHDYRRALLEFQNAVRITPKDADLYYQVAVCAEELKDWQLTGEALRRVIEINPKHRAAQLALASLERLSPDANVVKEALERAASVLAAAPNDAGALNSEAITEIRMGKLEEAARHLEMALANCPNCFADCQSLAVLKLAKGDPSGAETVLKQFAGRNPRSAEAFLALANFYMTSENRSLAQANVQKTLEIDPVNVNALLLLAKLQTSVGESTEAGLTYKRISALPQKSSKPLHAVFLYQQGNHNEAVNELRDLFKSDPSDRTIRSLLVSAYMDAGNARAAEEILVDALKKNPHDTDALLQRSAILIENGKLDEAQADLNSVLHFNPNSTDAHFGLARIAAARNIEHAERSELFEVLKLNRGFLSARIELASLLLRREPNDALKLLDDASPRQKTEDNYVLARNEALLALKKAPELRASLAAALKSKPSPRLLFQDAELKVLENDYAGARISLRTLLAQDPENMYALNLLAQTYLTQSTIKQALDVVNEYVARKPNSPYLLSVLGTWENKAGHSKAAHDAFAAALGNNTGYLPARLALAHLDASTGDLKEARQLLAAVPDKQMNSQVALGLGVIEQRSGNLLAARESFRAAIDMEPNNIEALIDLAGNLVSDKPAEARKYAEAAVELAPNNAVAEDTLGRVYYHLALYDLALKYFKSSVAVHQAGFNTYHLSLAYAKLGDMALSRRTLASAFQMDPTLNPGDVSLR